MMSERHKLHSKIRKIFGISASFRQDLFVGFTVCADEWIVSFGRTDGPDSLGGGKRFRKVRGKLKTAL